jgi:deoxyribose-phosphate aldolase
MQLAQFIDHTVLRPTTTLADIEKVCAEAEQYGFAAVCIPPYFVKDAAQILGNSGPSLATVVGFPFGYSNYRAKELEVAQALEDGANEIDLVMNIAAFRGNDLAWLESEIHAICRLMEEQDALLKVIIESGILTEEEIIRCCEIYRHYPVHFLKTSTGYAEKGAGIEAVKIMRKHLPSHIRIKASGGIRTTAFARELVEAGADRLGCSASVEIVKGA